MLPAKATILCIDDHWNGLIGRKMLLEENGYKVLEATCGVEGLKLFLSHPVDAVVLDYQMPGMNGDVVAARMKRLRSQVPIMLLSAQEPLPKNTLRSSTASCPSRSHRRLSWLRFRICWRVGPNHSSRVGWKAGGSATNDRASVVSIDPFCLECLAL